MPWSSNYLSRNKQNLACSTTSSTVHKYQLYLKQNFPLSATVEKMVLFDYSVYLQQEFLHQYEAFYLCHVTFKSQ